MGNLKDIQDITSLTSEAIFNIRKPVDYMCSDIDSHIKDIRTQCDYIMDGDEEDVKYYSKSIKSETSWKPCDLQRFAVLCCQITLSICKDRDFLYGITILH